MTTHEAVSTTDRNRRLLREASERLIAGEARASDGKLTLKALAIEAGVPRQYLYRSEYTSIAEDFERRAQQLRVRGVVPDPRNAEIEGLRHALAESRTKADRYREQLQDVLDQTRRAAAQIALMAEQERVLRKELAATQAALHAARDVASINNRQRT